MSTTRGASQLRGGAGGNRLEGHVGGSQERGGGREPARTPAQVAAEAAAEVPTRRAHAEPAPVHAHEVHGACRGAAAAEGHAPPTARRAV